MNRYKITGRGVSQPVDPARAQRESLEATRRRVLTSNSEFRPHAHHHVEASTRSIDGDSSPPLMVLGGEIDLDTIDLRGRGNTIVLPTGYGLCFDPSGRSLDKTALYAGPVEITNERIEKLPSFAKDWFGSDYEALKAYVDIPSSEWDSHAHVVAITYFRPGRYADDWFHEFSEPVPLLKQGRWYLMKLPRDCRITWRGIESP